MFSFRFSIPLMVIVSGVLPDSLAAAQSTSPLPSNSIPNFPATDTPSPLPQATPASQSTPVVSATDTPTPTAQPSARPKLSGLTDGPWNLPTCGFSLSLPAGWQGRTRKVSHRVMEGMFSDERGEPRQILIVEMGISNATSLRGHVDLFLRDGNAQLLGSSTLLDNKPAYRLKLSGPYPGMGKVWAQQQVITAAYGKQTFTLIVMADKDEKIEDTVNAILRGWHWQPFALPASYLQLSSEPLRLPKARLRLSMPRSMGVFSMDETSALLSAYDARNNLAAFTLNIASISGPKPFSLAAMRKNYGAVLQQMLDLPRPLTWTDTPGQPPRTMSNFFEMPIVLPDVPGPSLTSYGLVKRQGNAWVMLTFNINTQDAKSRTLYQAAARKILDSIRDEPSNAGGTPLGFLDLR